MSAEEEAALDRLAERGAEWLEAKAARRDTSRADARYSAAMRDFRRAERRRRRAEKREA